MGKKSKILYISVLLVNIVCFVLDLLPIPFPFFRISFAVSLCLMGALLFARSVSLKLDSSMFFGTVLFLCGIINFAQYFGGTYFALDPNFLWPYYLFAIALGCLVTGIYFKARSQFKIFVLFLGFGLITVLFVHKIIVLWLFITLLILWFVLYFVVNTVIFKKRAK